MPRRSTALAVTQVQAGLLPPHSKVNTTLHAHAVYDVRLKPTRPTPIPHCTMANRFSNGGETARWSQPPRNPKYGSTGYGSRYDQLSQAGTDDKVSMHILRSARAATMQSRQYGVNVYNTRDATGAQPLISPLRRGSASGIDLADALAAARGGSAGMGGMPPQKKRTPIGNGAHSQPVRRDQMVGVGFRGTLSLDAARPHALQRPPPRQQQAPVGHVFQPEVREYNTVGARALYKRPGPPSVYVAEIERQRSAILAAQRRVYKVQRDTQAKAKVT